MTENKNKIKEPVQKKGRDKKDSNKKLHVKNPFNKNDNRKITLQDIESEQEFKEAQTERD